MDAIPVMKRNEVVVIGDVFCDIMTLPIEAYPERDKQIGCEFMLALGGQAGNCAAACATLGLETALVCKIGTDALSCWVRAELERRGVVLYAQRTEDAALQRPGITVSIAFTDGSRSMLSDRGANLVLAGDEVNTELLRSARFVMRAGHWNTEGLFPANVTLLKTAKAAGAFTGLDIGWSAYLGWTDRARESVLELLPVLDFLFVNEAELRELSGRAGREGAYELLRRGCKQVIVHQGVEGSTWIAPSVMVTCPAFAVAPVRPTGGGDVFNAGFIYAFLAGKEAEECLRFANACAALYITRKSVSTVFPSLDEVKDFYTRQHLKEPGESKQQ
ncbi:MAG TPA: carbohydrate kinase family protein [Methanomicrobia archaeon]|nr:carbohydrate kinase family protein [Methanomicrobia archaeon]